MTMRTARTLLLALALATSAAVRAQTPEQLEVFSNLTPEQQQAVLQQMGGSATASAPGTATTRPRDPGADDERRGASVRREPETPLPPVLKPADSVLLQVSI